MKTRFLFSTLLAASLLFVACDNDDDAPAKPEVTIHELGDGDNHGDDHTAYVGGSLHMDIEILAEGKIDYVQIIIHPEGDLHKSLFEHEEWELDTIFKGDGITGLKNLDFHKDLEISEEAEAGHYHFDVKVVDMEGNSASDEAELELLVMPL
ncbi:DUF4625 domain-containing protein [Carboxylicivirga sp. RSCT41]|uniref:DUF4625 domain-containing protein n=1 Tax=Carboxylicivirga agarovorans TaxID=3417570 RepID=UPI003D344F6C